MNKNNPRISLISYKFIIVAVLFIIAVVMIFFSLWPKFQDLQFTRREIQEKKLELERKEQYLMNLNRAEARLRDFEEQYHKLHFALPNNPSLPSLFYYFQEVCSESGLVLERVHPFTVSDSEEFLNLRETKINIDLAGSYSALKNFLTRVERSARLIMVEEISFEKEGDERLDRDFFKFNLKMKVYSY